MGKFTFSGRWPCILKFNTQYWCVGASSILTNSTITHHLNKGLQIHLDILCFCLNWQWKISSPHVSIAQVHQRIDNAKKDFLSMIQFSTWSSMLLTLRHIDIPIYWWIETGTVNLQTFHCLQLREAEQAIYRYYFLCGTIVFQLKLFSISSSPSSSRTALHPMQVLLFLVNIASLPTFDVTIVFVRVCWPSARQTLKSEA